MRSTGEVMGLADNFGLAYAKSELAAGNGVPSEGVAFLSTNDLDKENLETIARELIVLGFKLVATKGTANYLFLKLIHEHQELYLLFQKLLGNLLQN